MLESQFLGALGVFGFCFMWWLVTESTDSSIGRFGPQATVVGLKQIVVSPRFWQGLLESLKRLLGGLLIAACIGVPLGVFVGYSRWVQSFTYLPFQFLRMISPLSWTPVAIILLGIGAAPVYFLVSVASIWPIIINTSAGVRNVDPKLKEVAQCLGAKDLEIILYVVARSALPSVIVGLQLALGIAWIVLVPAEMLGVASGLGYMILDFRDVNDYGAITALIVIIGFLGVLLDLPLRLMVARLSRYGED